MTEVVNSCDSVGGASRQEARAFQMIPDSVEHFPKLSRHVPSIVVEPTDGGEVESGELRWPPDDVSSNVREANTQVTGSGAPAEEVEPLEERMGRV